MEMKENIIVAGDLEKETEIIFAENNAEKNITIETTFLSIFCC